MKRFMTALLAMTLAVRDVRAQNSSPSDVEDDDDDDFVGSIYDPDYEEVDDFAGQEEYEAKNGDDTPKGPIPTVTQLDYHDFISFSEGTLKKKLESVHASGEDSSFYLQNELKAHFGSFKLPTIQIDLVQVSDLERPVYDEPYPRQEVSAKAREQQSEEVDKAETKAEDRDDTFKANYDMLANVLRNGYSRNNQKFRDADIFPFDQDRLQKSIKHLSIVKHYNSENNRWSTQRDRDAEAEMTAAEKNLKFDLDLHVDFSFSVNEVRLNSGLNSDVLDTLDDSSVTEFELAQPFVADYELNQRQIVIYMVDCQKLDCKQKGDLWNKLTELIKDTPITFFFINEKRQMEPNNLAKQVELYVRSILENTEYSFNLETSGAKEVRFMGSFIKQLDQQIESFILPDINRFKRALVGFRFKSPLNFIMIGKDFHEFFGMFYHAKLLAQYLTNILTDSVFSLHRLHNRNRVAGDKLQKHDYEVKNAAAVAMRNSLKQKITIAVDMLVEYSHLLSSDQIDCSIYFPSDSGMLTKSTDEDSNDDDSQQPNTSYLECWSRKYGASLFCLFGIGLVSAFILYMAMGELKRQKGSTRTSSLMD